MHIHGVKITFHEDGKVTSAWEGYVGGKKAMTTTFLMSRQSEAQLTAHPRTSAKPAVRSVSSEQLARRQVIERRSACHGRDVERGHGDLHRVLHISPPDGSSGRRSLRHRFC